MPYKVFTSTKHNHNNRRHSARGFKWVPCIFLKYGHWQPQNSVTMKICVENLVDISKSAASPYLPVNTSFHLQKFFKLCLCLQITSLKKLSKAVITWAVRASLWAGSRLIHVACTSSHIWTAFPGRVWLKTAPGKGWYFLEECSKAAALAIWMG